MAEQWRQMAHDHRRFATMAKGPAMQRHHAERADRLDRLAQQTQSIIDSRQVSLEPAIARRLNEPEPTIEPPIVRRRRKKCQTISTD